ncbi:PREDICTED: uncharacterized protein LOC104711277 [Camelina sativa]|uniref:Uncharacterized protein LOC104711277 n=1 Tax=Camelina sativa TaxID=90675 RepID=A0ABM0TGY1_CAMSA|nr:PREDICTED: uncharacterized protein LOC104711277 [Camelina sativa]
MEVGQANLEPKTSSDPLVDESSRGSCLPGFGATTVKSSWWQRVHSNHLQEPRWWVRAFLKIREWSEIVAGPRWKTFMRRFNRDRPRGRKWDDTANFRYDPLSYTLSFEDEYKDDDDDEAGFGGVRSFSMRYASVPVDSSKATDDISVVDAVK